MASKGSFKDTQTSFAAGRFSSELYGRTDLDKYASAFKDSKNFFVSPEGTLLNRAGTEHIGEVVTNITHTYNPPGVASRVVPFIFSDDDVVLLVFGGHPHDPPAAYPKACEENGLSRGFVRFYKYDKTTDEFTLLDAIVREWDYIDLDVSDEKAWVGNRKGFPWCVEDPKNFRYVQVGDTISFTFKDAYNGEWDSIYNTYAYARRPFQLTRANADSTEWRYELLDFDVAAFPTNGGTPRLELHHEYVEGQSPTSDAAETGALPQPDGEHPARPWKWAVSRIMQSSSGEVYETLSHVITETVHYRVEAYEPTRTDYGTVGGVFNYVFIPESMLIPSVFAPSMWATLRTHWYYADSFVSPGHYPFPGGTDYWDEVDGDALDPVEALGHAPELVTCYVDRPVYVDWRVFTQRPEVLDANSAVVIGTRVYKGRDGHYGFIGETGPDAQGFVDDGITPDFATPPRTGDTHFVIPGNGALVSADGYKPPTIEWPSVLGMYEGRMLMASTLLRPGLVAGSAVEDYGNLDRLMPAKDADAFAFSLGSLEWERIRFFVARHGLYLFTSAGEWVASGSGQRTLLTPNSVAVRQVSNHGAALLHPLVIGDVVVFIDNIGKLPHALHMRGTESQTIDVAAVSREFFRGRKVVSWCWAEVPWLTMWLVMDDGKVLSCAFAPEQQLVAWAEHELQSGTPISSCAFPAADEHATVFLVRRGGKYYLERLRSRVLTDIRDSRFLDAHVFYDGRNTDTAKTCTVTSQAGDLVVGHDCDVVFSAGTESIIGSLLGLVVRVLATRQVDVYDDEEHGDYKKTETYFCDVKLIESSVLDVYTGELFTPLDADLDGVAITTYEICRFGIDGLSHLEGEDVVALADGDVVRGLTVEGGSVVLGPGEGNDAHAAVICVGLPYNCDFESLKVATERGRVRVVKGVIIETYGSRGGHVGQSFDDPRNLEEVLTREVQHEYGPIPLKVELTETVIRAAYDIEGVIAFRQSDPLPISITAIVRDLEFGG